VRLGGEFWEPTNHQGLCAACHNSKSGREAHKPHTYSK
jgi:5-methylcytosine-specific restriction endonuclease McrA